jgi:hypothetical protein
MQINNALSSIEDKNHLKSLIKYVSDADKFANFEIFYNKTFLPSVYKKRI